MGSLDLSVLNNLYDETQYFWFESSAQPWGAGAHVTLYPQSEFTTSTHANYLKGQNILMNTDGLSIRNGTLPMMTLDNDSLDFNVVDATAGTWVTTATFASTGVQIGQSGAAHSVIDANGQRFYGGSNGTTQLANIGYDDGASLTTVSKAPFYTFGIRRTTTTAYSSSSTYSVGDMCVYDEKIYVCTYDIATPEEWTSSHWRYYIGQCSHAEGLGIIASGYGSYAEGQGTITIGTYSHAEGHDTITSGYSSHAEGYGTIASGYTSHAEGNNTTASGNYSHVEGDETTASGAVSHAEGYGAIASGAGAHAQNFYTVATEGYQTVIGRYNVVTVSGSGTDADPYTYSDAGDYAFIIGNGYGNATAERSNALTVDWYGNVELQGDITLKGHGSPVGDIAAGTETTKSNSATATWVEGSSVPLGNGVWVITAHVNFAQNTTGRRAIAIYSGTAQMSASLINQPPTSGAVTHMVTTYILSTSGSTVSVRHYQTSGGQLSATSIIRAVRIR